ncbi:MAG: carbamoyltransferase HypF [Coriobacteriia bacterium]|nr:carbamoyltransferase HypF [Coriobacteriia bacterium]
MEALHVQVKGIVQGVGFRPFVYRLAHEHGLNGWVLNSVEGVFIRVEGDPDELDRFVIRVSEEAPAAAQVSEIDIEEVEPEGYESFEIHFSDDVPSLETTFVSPDLATCDACVSELFDPSNRRYRYPFINCTNCGPRFTILRQLPYDRANTSMRAFKMCPECQGEYDDPSNRRFHAQPDACFDCGPQIGWVRRAEQSPALTDIEWASDRDSSDKIIAAAVELLREGGILALKGLGGYHLVCDAANEQALANLRARKHRDGKAFAVMLGGLDEVREFCQVNDAEAEQLEHPARPIVLLKKRPDVSFAVGLADKLPELGVMLPATPLQHLIVNDFGGMLVMTSGNLHDMPIVTTEADLFDQLGSIADGFVVNNREIISRYDDSVLRIFDLGEAGYVTQFVRRARGYAPAPLNLEPSAQDLAGTGSDTEGSAAEPHQLADMVTANRCVLAAGPEQKNTFTFARGGKAFNSQHLGDLEDAASFDAWLETMKLYERLMNFNPTVLVADAHPEYLPSKWAREQAKSRKLPLLECQHHHAHILSVMGENKLAGPVCGIAFDGTGYGFDGSIWGGEVLLCNLQAFERFANFAYFPLPGGAAAVKNPDRTAFGALWAFDLLDHPGAKPLLDRLSASVELLEQMIEKGINSPMTSSVGRLFDAVAALTGVCSKPTYQGEAAILLEALVHQGIAEGCLDPSNNEAYPIDLIKNTATESSTAEDTSVVLFDAAPAFKAILDDVAAGTEPALIAQRFHNAMVQVILQAAQLVYNVYGVTTVALGGGVFLNRYLSEHAVSKLIELGFTVALNRELPPSDASVSYGQAVLALNAHEPFEEE